MAQLSNGGDRAGLVWLCTSHARDILICEAAKQGTCTKFMASKLQRLYAYESTKLENTKDPWEGGSLFVQTDTESQKTGLLDTYFVSLPTQIDGYGLL